MHVGVLGEHFQGSGMCPLALWVISPVAGFSPFSGQGELFLLRVLENIPPTAFP